MANGNGDPMSGMPWWIKAIVIVGVPSAIALGLVWSDRTQLTKQVNQNGVILSQMEEWHTGHDNRTMARFDELRTATVETNRILTVTCVNAAQDAAARERCVGR